MDHDTSTRIYSQLGLEFEEAEKCYITKTIKRCIQSNEKYKAQKLKITEYAI